MFDVSDLIFRHMNDIICLRSNLSLIQFSRYEPYIWDMYFRHGLLACPAFCTPSASRNVLTGSFLTAHRMQSML